MNKAFRILEIIWLAMGCVGIIMCAYSTAISDNRGAIYFLVFTLACVMMYAVRKRQRIKFEKKATTLEVTEKEKEIKK